MFVVLPVMNEFDVRIYCSGTSWYQLLLITTSYDQLDANGGQIWGDRGQKGAFRAVASQKIFWVLRSLEAHSRLNSFISISLRYHDIDTVAERTSGASRSNTVKNR